MMNVVIENQFIEKCAGHLKRSPLQQNRLQETDAEIVRLSGHTTLAVTTDSIVEEIALGFYTDPYLAGWMSIMANLSDLAAVGAEPIGVLVSEVLPTTFGDEAICRLQQGMQDACSACGTFILGGDTNFDDRLLVSGMALGSLQDGKFLSRIGCTPGDILFATDRLGIGNAYVFSLLHAKERPAIRYQPIARLKEGISLVGLATACMDTSDGVLSTLDQLMRLNKVGFELSPEWESSLDHSGRELARSYGIPAWLLLAGQHGEFELIFTIPERGKEDFIHMASKVHWLPREIGTVIREPEIRLPLSGTMTTIDTARIRNLDPSHNGSAESYLTALLEIDREMKKGVVHHVDH
jgi:thiamine-monophosphate kinase